MGLRGDTSDNIPGVPGIGEKTATQLLQQFGSLEKVLASVDKISGAKRKQNLVEHADDARMSKQLATLQYEIETGVDLAAAMDSEPDRGALRDFMREFELRAVMERLEEALPRARRFPAAASRPSSRSRRRRGRPPTSARARRHWRSPAIAGRPPKASASSPARRPTTSWRWRSPAAPFVAHDAKSLGGGRHGLLAAAAREGVELTLDHDTMVAAYLLEPQRRTYELTELAADAGIGLAEGAAARPPTRTTASSRSARRSRRGSTRPRRRASSPPWPRSSGPRIEELGPGADCCARSSCRWSTCWRRWSARA